MDNGGLKLKENQPRNPTQCHKDMYAENCFCFGLFFFSFYLL